MPFLFNIAGNITQQKIKVDFLLLRGYNNHIN